MLLFYTFNTTDVMSSLLFLLAPTGEIPRRNVSPCRVSFISLYFFCNILKIEFQKRPIYPLNFNILIFAILRENQIDFGNVLVSLIYPPGVKISIIPVIHPDNLHLSISLVR